MASPSPNASKLRAALEWWRGAARISCPPVEADFVTQDPQRYASLLSDSFIVDATADGGLAFRFVGTELSDYIGWSVPGQRLDLASRRRDTALIRDALGRAVETLSPHLTHGRIVASPEAGPDAFEAICLPLTTASGGSTFFGAVARSGHWRLPPAPQNHRVEVEIVLDLGSSAVGGRTGDGAADTKPSLAFVAASLFPREA